MRLPAGCYLQRPLEPMLHLVSQGDEYLDVSPNGIILRETPAKALCQLPGFRFPTHHHVFTGVIVSIVIIDSVSPEFGMQEVQPRAVHVEYEVTESTG
jgi:hypothetical protein